MKIRLLTTTAELVDLFRDWYKKADDIRVVTAWATTDCPDCLACKELTAARGAISTLVGLHFFQTASSFLDSADAKSITELLIEHLTKGT